MSRIGEIAEAIREEMGAPISLASTAQAYAGLAHITEAAKILRNFSFSEDLGAHRVVKEPIGVCGDYAVELADESGDLQSGTCTGSWLHNGS